MNEVYSEYTGTEQEEDYRNKMWRNWCVSDTYEPGSTFKIITTAAALEEDLVSVEENFYCPGYIMVEARRIRCHKTTGHGSENFAQAIQNSCNPIFNIMINVHRKEIYLMFERLKMYRILSEF